MSPHLNRRILFVQPYGLAGNGGGSRILTSMIRGQPFQPRSLNSHFNPAPKPDWTEERHVPVRPELGRLDRTRFSWTGHYLEIAARPFFEKRLAREIREWQPDVVHVVPHASTDFHLAGHIARGLGCRVVMSVHDDLGYNLPPRHPFRAEALRKLGEMWREADHLFVISRELGEEYNRRYGTRDFDLITDGLETVPAAPVPVVPGRLNVYFMGLFHYAYRENLRTLARALARLKKERPELDLRLTMRCGSLGNHLDLAFPVEVLPFADQGTVLADMARADLLYLPLPVGDQYETFTRYSLSTKMVSYLGSGVPVLYHGPADAAAGKLLARHDAAFACSSLDDSDMSGALNSWDDTQVRLAKVTNALALARESFSLEHLRAKFLRGLLP